MAGFSTHLAHALINHVFRGGAYTAPAGTYLALFTADPTDENVTANELAGGWYARQQVTSWSAPAAGATANSNAITFPAVTGSAVTITHWGLYDALTTGNLLASGALVSSAVLNVNDVYVINAGSLTLTWD